MMYFSTLCVTEELNPHHLGTVIIASSTETVLIKLVFTPMDRHPTTLGPRPGSCWPLIQKWCMIIRRIKQVCL